MNFNCEPIGCAPASEFFDDRSVLALLAAYTYEDALPVTNWSRGRIHRLASQAGACKPNVASCCEVRTWI